MKRVSDYAVADARAVPIAEAVAAYTTALRRHGHELVGACPVCGGVDRFAVHLRRGIFNCRGCACGGDVIDLVRHVEGVGFTEAVERLTGNAAWQFSPRIVPHVERDDDADAQARQASAIKRFDEASTNLSGVVEAYLRSRALDDFDDLSGRVLRAHAHLPWRDDDGEVVHVPALVAAMRHVETDELTAIIRTALAPDGRKVGRRQLGSARRAAVKLDRPGDDPAELTVAEGAETAIAARMLGLRRVWAMGGTAGVANLPVLPGVQRLTLLEERDENGASPRAVAECGNRWAAAGRQVTVIRPPAGLSDLNDVVRSLAR